MVAYCRSRSRRAAAVRPAGRATVAFERQCRRPVRGAGCVTAIEALQPRPPVLPPPDIVTGRGDSRQAIALQAAQTLRHAADGAELCLQFFVVTLCALRDQHGLREIRRVDHRQLRLSGSDC